MLPSFVFRFARAPRARAAVSLVRRVAVVSALPGALLCGAALVGCKEGRAASQAEMASRVSAASAAASEAQPAGLRWAKTVDWSRRGDAVALTIREPWKGARAPLRYAVANGARPPEAGKGVQGVTAPARRIAALAAVHTGFLAALNATDRIVAVDARRHVYHADVRAGLAAGTVVEVGSGAALNVERLLAAKPDLVLANAVGASEYDALERLRRAGVPVLVTAEWMERHPLARAEWVRLFGILIGEPARADSLFAAVEAAYLKTAETARHMPRKPTVFLGGPFRDQWFVSGGRSYMARLIGDAGGDYLWSGDTTAGGVPLNFEAVLARARRADVWLHPGDWRRLADGLRQDERFARFDALRRGDVYNSDNRLHADGANDYWETGVVRPDLILSDLLSVFHGTEDTLYYYRRMPP